MKKCKKCSFGSKLLTLAAVAMFTPYQITVKDGEIESKSLALTINAKMQPEDNGSRKLDLVFTFFGGKKPVHPMDKMKECCDKITDAVNKAKEKKAGCCCDEDECPCEDNAPDSTPEAARNCDEDGVDADESSEAEAEKGTDAE